MPDHESALSLRTLQISLRRLAHQDKLDEQPFTTGMGGPCHELVTHDSPKDKVEAHATETGSDSGLGFKRRHSESASSIPHSPQDIRTEVEL